MSFDALHKAANNGDKNGWLTTTVQNTANG